MSILRQIMSLAFVISGVQASADQSALKAQPICESFLAGQAPHQTYRDSVDEYIREIREKAPIIRIGNWESRVNLKSALVRNALAKMAEALTKRLGEFQAEMSANPSKQELNVLRSAKILIEETSAIQQSFQTNGLSYQAFLKLSNVYAFQFSLLNTNREWREFAIKRQEATTFMKENGFKVTYFPRPADESKILTSVEHLRYHLNSNTFNRELSTSKADVVFPYKVPFSYFSGWKQPFILIPSMANLGFETILHAQSLGAGFIGVAASNRLADGVLKSPDGFFDHDLDHASIIAEGAADLKFWENLRLRLEPMRLADARRFSIAMGMLFVAFHEQNRPQMNCKVVTESDIANNTQERLSRPNDLGIAVKGERPSMDEVASVHHELLDVIQSVCRNSK